MADLVPIVFSTADAARPPASVLLETMVAELDALYGMVDGDATRFIDPAELAPPRGTYLVGWVDGLPVAGGGLRSLDDDTAEVKRMFVAPAHRGLGYAGALLGALEARAVDFGYRVARLDTGPLQPHAKRLYLRSGYVSIPSYNGNWHADFWGEKKLV